MPNFRYRALTQSGEVVTGMIAASTAAEVQRRMDYLRLVPIDHIVEQSAATRPAPFRKGASAEDVTIFTLDLALLLKAGARLDDALDLLATDSDIGRLRSTVGNIRACLLSGMSFADALANHPTLFPPMYLALVRVGEASGSLENILQVLFRERSRAEALRRKLTDSLRYPIFVLFAAICVLIFFLMFVLPQFSTVLKDFGAEVDPVAGFFIQLSGYLTTNKDWIGLAALIFLGGGLYAARQPRVRSAVIARLLSLPVIRTLSSYHRASMFCRNLDVLLSAAVPLTAALRILADMIGTISDGAIWTGVVEQVRQGKKLSEALGATEALPGMALRMLRLGEETGQLPVLAGRVADFYETKLQRSLDRVVGLVGPLAIIAISVIVGGLIVSVMTSLLSVSQLVG